MSHESMLFAFSVANVVSQSDYSKVVRIAWIANAHRVQPSSKAQKKTDHNGIKEPNKIAYMQIVLAF